MHSVKNSPPLSFLTFDFMKDAFLGLTSFIMLQTRTVKDLYRYIIDSHIEYVVIFS